MAYDRVIVVCLLFFLLLLVIYIIWCRLIYARRQNENWEEKTTSQFWTHVFCKRRFIKNINKTRLNNNSNNRKKNRFSLSDFLRNAIIFTIPVCCGFMWICLQDLKSENWKRKTVTATHLFWIQKCEFLETGTNTGYLTLYTLGLTQKKNKTQRKCSHERVTRVCTVYMLFSKTTCNETYQNTICASAEVTWVRWKIHISSNA